MSTEPTTADALAERVIGCAIAVHRALGPGLLESIYHACLLVEFRHNGLKYDTQRHITLTYRDDEIRPALIVDSIVEGRLLVELKAVERLHPVHFAQVITYLKLTGIPLGLLINFNTPSLRLGGIRRLEHPDVYTQRPRPIYTRSRPTS